MINIEDLECVGYDQIGILKNVNELCEYLINNSNESSVDKLILKLMNNVSALMEKKISILCTPL